MSSTDIDNLKNLFNIIQAHSSGKASGSVTMYESPIKSKDKYKEIFESKSVDEDKLKNAVDFIKAVNDIKQDEATPQAPKTKTFTQLLDGDLKGLISYEERSTAYGTVTLLKTDKDLADTKKTDLYELFAADNNSVANTDTAHSTLEGQFGKDLAKNGSDLNTNDDALETLKAALDLLEEAPLDRVTANKDIVAQIKKLTDFTTTVQTSSPSTNYSYLPLFGGGARNFVGEFEAYKNTMNIERSSIKMIGGGSDVWSPGLEKDATRRSTLFAQVFSSVKAELAKHNKALSKNDSDAIEAAINSLAKRESNIYGELKTLNKYAQLLNKYKDVKDGEVVDALKNQTNISALVSKYFKNVARADKKSSKLGAVFGSLMMSLPGGLLIGL